MLRTSSRFESGRAALASIATLLLIPAGEAEASGKPKGRPPHGPPPFYVVEAGIVDIHDAILKRRTTCNQLVKKRLKLIEAYSG